MMRFCTLACVALLSVFEVSPAMACTRFTYGLSPYGWFPVQDPNVGPTLASGSDLLLLQSPCIESGCSDETWGAKILDARGVVLPAKLEDVDLAGGTFPGAGLMRLRPKSPLEAGDYTLQTSYQWRTNSEEHSYPFRVAGRVSDTSSARFNVRVAEYIEDMRVPVGTELACDVVVQTTCGPMSLPPVHTQQRPEMAVSAQRTDAGAEIERNQYMFRLVATGAGASVEPTSWHQLESGTVTLTFGDLRLPKYCVELQALRLRDAKIQSHGRFCLAYAVSEAREPAHFAPCQQDPMEYARAYCADNAFICSADNPDAMKPSVQLACDVYAALCAPLIGNRTPSDRLSCQR
jgi:hypothetical protein